MQMTEELPDTLHEEVKVPVFCEFIFEKNLASSNVDGDGTTFYKYFIGLPATSIGDILYESLKYSLPGFPGIKYYFVVDANIDTFEMNFQICVKFDYAIFLVDFDFTYTINNNKPENYHVTIDNETEEKGFYMYPCDLLNCSDECTGCAACKDKIFVVRVEGIMTVKNIDFLRISFFEEDYNLYDNNDTKDFALVVEEKEIWVHKSILIKNSTVFARMLDSDKWKETIENKIIIPEFSFEAVNFAVYACYGFPYDTDIIPKINLEDYLIIYRFADKYDMEKLKKAIKETVVFTPSIVVRYANFFLQNNYDELVICCIDYILNCSQSSLPIKDIEMLDPQIHSMFFDRALVSPVLKKDPKIEHRTVYKEHIEKKE